MQLCGSCSCAGEDVREPEPIRTRDTWREPVRSIRAHVPIRAHSTIRAIRPALLTALAVALPAQALAWGLVVPEIHDGDTPCIRYSRYEVEVDVSPDEARTRLVLEFSVGEPMRATLVMPRLDPAGNPSARLDGAALALAGLDANAATERIVTMASARPVPSLLASAGRSAHFADLSLAVGTHTLELESTPFVERRADTPRIWQPLRLLGTACGTPTPTIEARVEWDRPLGSVFTPFHDAAISRPSPLTAELAMQPGPPDDLELYLIDVDIDANADRNVAAHVLAWREPACDDGNNDGGNIDDGNFDDGYAVVAAGSTVTTARDALAKDIVFVTDRSGSMSGDKIEQVRAALLAILDGLGPDDRFELVTFAGEADSMVGELQDAGDSSRIEAARARVRSLDADGGTNIDDALALALSMLHRGDHDRPRLVLFLTDGQATAGETNTDAILRRVEAINELGVRVFSFGVGNDVNTYLLDELGRRTGASTHYVLPGGAIDETLAGFYREVQAPLVTDLALEGDGVELSGAYPETLPNLYVGTQIVATMRYGDTAAGGLRLTGRQDGAARAYDVDGPLVRSGSEAWFLPRLWASRRLGELLYAARQNGGDASTVDEIRALADRYGFVTPWTSYSAAADGSVARDYNNPTHDRSGAEAVGTSAAVNDISANNMAGAYSGDGSTPIRYARGRAFFFEHGYWRDASVDAAVHDDELDGIVDVRYGGDDWRALVDASPALREMLAVGRHTIVAWRCQVLRVTDPETAGDAAIPAPDAVPPAWLETERPDRLPAPVPAMPRADRDSGGCAVAPPGDAPWPWAVFALTVVLLRRRRCVLV